MILDFLLPAPCVICGRLPKPICDNCEIVAQVSISNIGSLGVFSAGILEGDLEQLVRSYKDKHRIALENSLRKLLSASIEEARQVHGFDGYALPPSNRVNYRQRGFNPVERLARNRSLLKLKRVPISATRRLIDQRGLSFQQRKTNLNLAFSAQPGKGNILLIDDVMTTGATMQELARCLRSAGYAVTTGCVVANRSTSTP
jgi:ComF family protein